MKYKAKPLTYSYDGLEPHLSALIVETHYGVRTHKYFDTANEMRVGTVYEDMTLEQLLTRESIAKIDSKLFVQASQAWNHDVYWAGMSPIGKTGECSDQLITAINESFGSMDKFIDDFIKLSMSLVGSGWTWLLLRNNQLVIKNIPNAGSPLVSDPTAIPLLVCDCWEHAWEAQRPTDKKGYMEAFFQVINWTKLSKKLADAKK